MGTSLAHGELGEVISMELGSQPHLTRKDRPSALQVTHKSCTSKKSIFFLVLCLILASMPSYALICPLTFVHPIFIVIMTRTYVVKIFLKVPDH